MADGRALDENEIAESFKEIDKNYPNIWNYTDEDVEHCKQKLDDLNRMQAHYDEQSQTLKYIRTFVHS